MAKVTYTPRDPADPVRTKMAGISFEANVPREVSHPEVIRNAGHNPWFKVEGESDESAVAKNRGGRPPLPKTDGEYRAHAIAWIQKSESVADLDARWAKEADLRERCEIGSDDLDLIEPFLTQRREQLQRAASE